MPSGSRDTGGVNTTDMQEKYRSTWGQAKPPTLEERARRFLKQYLADGPKTPTEVKAAFEEAGFKEYLADKVKALLEVESYTDDGTWYWRLPDAEPEEPVDIIVEGKSEQGEDEYSLTADERAMFGIKPTEQHAWIRDPNVWNRLAPGDSARKFLRDNPGGRIIYHNGDTVTNGDDLILAVLPKALVEKRRALESERDRDLQRQIEAERMDDDEFDPSNKQEQNRRKHFNTMEHVQRGMIGPQSPSSGMPYEDYIRNRGLTAEEIEREERSYSLRGFSQQELDGDDAARVIADERSRRAQEQPRGAGGKFYSIPPNVKPRNLARAEAK